MGSRTGRVLIFRRLPEMRTRGRAEEGTPARPRYQMVLAAQVQALGPEGPLWSAGWAWQRTHQALVRLPHQQVGNLQPP